MNLTLRKSIIALLLAIIAVGALSYFYYLKSASPGAPVKARRIGLLLTEKDVQSDNIRGFKDGLKALGYEEGKNIVYVEKRAGADRDLLAREAKELNASGVDVIVVAASSAAEAAKKLPDLKTPVFFLAAGRPRDLVKNLQSPEGWITGIGEGTIEFSGKRLELLKEAVPSVKRVISIVERKHPNFPLFRKKNEAAAKALGLEMVYLEIEKTDDLPSKLSLITRARGDAFLGAPVPSNQKYAKELAAQLLKAKLPSVNDELGVGAKIGFLITYSDDRYKTGFHAAEHIDQLLKGVPVSQIAVEFARNVVLELNLKTAKEIGVVFPEGMRLRANKIYQ